MQIIQSVQGFLQIVDLITEHTIELKITKVGKS